MKKIIVFLLITCIFFSCTLETTSNKGSICVSNYSEDDSFVITNIYLKLKDSQGYILHFIGEIKNGNSQFLEVNPGEYSVMVDIEQTLPDLSIRKTTEDTGYNYYKLVDNEHDIEVIFDGEGIFFNPPNE